jgi:hypothetical protein
MREELINGAFTTRPCNSASIPQPGSRSNIEGSLSHASLRPPLCQDHAMATQIEHIPLPTLASIIQRQSRGKLLWSPMSNFPTDDAHIVHMFPQIGAYPGICGFCL